MANVIMNQLKHGIATQSINLDTDTLKFMLCTSVYVPNADDTFIDDGSADDAASGEISVTGYTGGFGGAGRKTLAATTLTQDDVFDRSELTATSPVTWTALSAGATIAWIVLIKEITNDAASLVLTAFDVTDTPTSGADFVASLSSNGFLRIT